MSPRWVKPDGNPYLRSVFAEAEQGLAETVGEFAELEAVVDALCEERLGGGSASTGGTGISPRSTR